jgi:uncharacterized protein YqgC (DUF456 family)
MLAAMDYIWPILLTLVNAAWLVSIIAGLPGTWLMVGSAILLQWLRGVEYFSIATLVVVTVLAGVGELFEFATGVAGAKAAGGTRHGAAGALLGGLVGAIVGTFVISIPLVGTLIGACLGAASGTILLEARAGMPTQASVRAGVGAGIGRLLGTVMKLAIGVIIWLILAIAAFWP